MKTRDRILHTALELFNEEGEPNVTTVDIANEMEISPGNLYYHFKGKEQLIIELYNRFDERMTEYLTAPIEHPLEIDDNWFFLYVIFEEIYKFHFFYDNLTDILQRYESIDRRFRRLLELKRATAAAICHSMVEKGVLRMSSEEVGLLSTTITMTVTYWLNFQTLQHQEQEIPVQIHRGVYQVMSLVAPHLAGEKIDFAQLYEHVIVSMSEE